MLNRKILIYVSAAILIAALVVVANTMRNNSQVSGLRVELEYNGSDTLITASRLERQISADLTWVNHTKVKDVDKDAVNTSVMKSPFIERCNTSVSVRGAIVVKAVQRRPIVRMFANGEEFYVDALCKKMPLSEDGDGNVLVANSQKSHITNADAHKLYRLAEYLYQHPDYGVLFDQVYLDQSSQLCLVPKVFNHIVVVGDNDSLNFKMEKLWHFYTHVMPQKDCNAYSVINLKYSNQVVCGKEVAR